MEHDNQRPLRGGKYLLVLLLLLVANSAYLAAFGDPTLFYVANALLHPLLGAVVGALFIVFLARHHRGLAPGWLGPGLLPLGLSAAFGIYLVFVGMTRPHSLALYGHVGLAALGLVWLLFRLRRSGLRSEFRRAWQWSLGAVLASVAFYGAATLYQRALPNPQDMIRNPSTAPLSMEEEGSGRNSLVFPSSAQTADGRTINSEFFMNSESCKPCHADIYKQWQSSMHHMASFNNQWYRKSIEYMQDTIGVKPSLWCGGCHDHALVFAGKMQVQPLRQIVDTPEAQAGLGCMSCHAIVQVKSTMGQGRLRHRIPAPRSLGFEQELRCFMPCTISPSNSTPNLTATFS